MRNITVFLIVILIIWITGSSYWYVCRVRHDCRCCQSEQAPVPSDDKDSLLKASVDEALTFLKSGGKQTVFFKPSSADTEINTLAPEYITRLKLWLDNTPSARVTVTGHTDSSGPKDVNVKLSQARAEFVRDYLVSSGISADRIDVLSMVSSQPLASNDDAEGRAKNRRAEIEIKP